MKDIIYSKFSNERADKFKIITYILKDENSLLHVEKHPLNSEASFHISNMYNTYALLCSNYSEELLSINKCSLKNRFVQFEYIHGETLEERIDELLSINDLKGLFVLVEKYKDVIYSGNNIKTFEITDDFVNIFGNTNLPTGLKACDVSNIDIIFSNIIINTKWNLIDYEWTFNFPIPLNYTIYRAISYYINSSNKRSKLLNEELLKFLGITEEESVEYEIMERNFQNYVIGNSLTSAIAYNAIHGKSINVNYLKEHVLNLENTIKELEDKLVILELRNNEIAELRNKVEEKEIIIAELIEKGEKIQDISDHDKINYQAAMNRCDELDLKLTDISNGYNSIISSNSWKITKPLRKTIDIIKKIMK